MQFENVAENLRESFRVIAASRGPGEVRELPGVSIASAGVTFQMFNAAFLSTPVTTEAELTQRIMLPSLHFNTRGLEWAYWVCDDFMESRPHRRSRHIRRPRTDLPLQLRPHDALDQVRQHPHDQKMPHTIQLLRPHAAHHAAGHKQLESGRP